MENDSSLFSLSIDPSAKTQLYDAAKWARVLAIGGMVFLLLIIVARLYTVFFISGYRSGLFNDTGAAETAGSIFATFLIMLVPLFPLLFLLRFSNAMKKAIAADDQHQLTAAFKNLKIYLRYLAIITLIFLVVMAVSFIITLVGLAR